MVDGDSFSGQFTAGDYDLSCWWLLLDAAYSKHQVI
jgi:hypothetical protein